VLVLVADANHQDPLLQDRIRSVVHDICRVRSGPARDILFVEADEKTLQQASNVAYGVAAGPGSSVVLVDVGLRGRTTPT
jgi:Flp pilus assembly CpaE family ATPase